MKKTIFRLMLLVSVAASLQRCADEGESARPEKVQFTYSFTDTGGESGRVEANAVPAALLLSVTTAAGESVFLNKRVELIRLGESFITEPLDMTPGSYQVSDFLLVNSDDVVIYATPRKGAPLAKIVNRPLPNPFSVIRNKATNVAMAVVYAGVRPPEDFGYVSFPVNVVNPLELSVLASGNNGASLTSAKAYIVEGSDTIKTYNLGATINLLSFPGDTQVPRKLIVTKPGYNKVEQEFVYDDLLQTLNGTPWKIVLIPALFTLDAVLNPDYQVYSEIGLAGMPGALTIDWGDGTSETVSLGEATTYHHDYAAGNTSARINVTGDLDKITDFVQIEGVGQSSYINVQGLTGLKRFLFGVTSNLAEVLDFTYNNKLEYLELQYSYNLHKVILPEHHILRYLNVEGNDTMNTTTIDALIDQLYQGVSESHLDGRFYFSRRQIYPPQPIGPPSPAAIAKLHALRDTYNWTIVPLP